MTGPTVRTINLAEHTQFRLVPHSRWWSWKFRWERALIRFALGRRIGAIDHFGSTSISGMPAKPIIDIQIELNDIDDVSRIVHPLRRIGYVYRGLHAKRREHLLTKGDPIQVHLYLLERENEIWSKRAAFRDSLNRDPGGADWTSYAELKQQLFKEAAGDLRTYQAGKLWLVEEILSRSQIEQSG